MKLQDIAIARSGDKGDRATLSVIARNPADYPLLERMLTAERVKAHYAGVVRGGPADRAGMGCVVYSGGSCDRKIPGLP